MLLNEEKIREIVREVLKEAIGFGFSMGYLKNLPNYAAKVRYCKQYLGRPIGNGSSRMVFQLDDRWVLKLAKNRIGIAQNEHEGHEDHYRDSYEVFPEVNYELSDMEGFTYIVSEYVLPAKAKDFKKCLGISGFDFYDFLKKCSQEYRPKQWSFMSDQEYNELIENNEILNHWRDYMCDYQVAPFDLRNANFGMTLRDGEPTIVMLDSGLDEEIFKMYYKR